MDNLEAVVDGAFDLIDETSICLLGDRCCDCGCTQFPSRLACDACCSRNLERARLGSAGVLWSSAVDRLGMLLGEPYGVAEVQMHDGPVVQGYLVGDLDDRPPPGTPMVVVPYVIPAGEGRPELLGFGFQPAGARGA